MTRPIRHRGRNHWHTDGRPAGFGTPLAPRESLPERLIQATSRAAGPTLFLALTALIVVAVL